MRRGGTVITVTAVGGVLEILGCSPTPPEGRQSNKLAVLLVVAYFSQVQRGIQRVVQFLGGSSAFWQDW